MAMWFNTMVLGGPHAPPAPRESLNAGPQARTGEPHRPAPEPAADDETPRAATPRARRP
jgi:hypothetical protein